MKLKNIEKFAKSQVTGKVTDFDSVLNLDTSLVVKRRGSPLNLLKNSEESDKIPVREFVSVLCQ